MDAVILASVALGVLLSIVMMPVHVFILCDFLCVAVEGLCFCFNVSVFQCNVMSVFQSDVDLQINNSEVRCFERYI